MVLIVAIDVAAWIVGCQTLERGLRDFIVKERQAGWALTTEAVAWTGWPFAAELSLSGVAVRNVGAGLPPGLDWIAPRVAVRLSPLHPATLGIAARGEQTVAMVGVAPISFTSKRLDIAIDLTGTDPVHGEIRDLAAALPAGTTAPSLLRVATASLDLMPTRWAVRMGGIGLPGQPLPIDALEGTVSVVPMIEPAATSAASARAWQAAGGHVTIETGTLRWDALSATFTGQGALDAGLQLAGTGEIVATGLPAFIDQLVGAGAMTKASAGPAKAVLALLSRPGEPTRLPISVRDGIVSAARFPLLRLPKLSWD